MTDRQLYRHKITSIYMTPEIKAIGKRLAAQEHISFSAAIARIIREWQQTQETPTNDSNPNPAAN